MSRIFFNNFRDRKRFFESVKSKTNLSWSSLAKELGTTRTMMDRYRGGRLGIPSERFSVLKEYLASEEKSCFTRIIETKENNWGQIIGGKKAYQSNKEAFDIGRRTEGRKVKYDFDINIPLSEELCEFLGVIIGDGCTNKYANMYQTQVAGDKLLDKEYYTQHLSSICKSLFGISPKISIRPNGIYLNMYSKRVFELLTNRFKIPAGVKCYTVKIPQEIFDGEETMKCFVLRGMFNTDGGVGIDRRKKYKRPYIRVNYTSSSFTLIKQIHHILSEYGVPHSIHDKNDFRAKQIQINGENNVKLFIDKIGFSNPRHTRKIAYLLGTNPCERFNPP